MILNNCIQYSLYDIFTKYLINAEKLNASRASIIEKAIFIIENIIENN